MNIQESCNDSHLVSVSLTEDDIQKILKGKVVFIECEKDETQIYIGKDIA
tara:strand:- start:209 stop:358 length:150 start_codon:yes stop_codon:yes gene_type:complete